MPIGLTDWQLRVLSLPTLLRVLITFGLLTPFLLCLSVAIDGHTGVSPGVTGALIGGVAASWWTNRDVSNLDRSARRSVLLVTLTGRPSGNGEVDAIAHRRLERASRTSPVVNRAMGVAVIVAMVATPLIAAHRAGSSEWLLGWVSIPLAFALTPTAVFAGDARARLRSIEDATGAASAE